MPLFSFSAAAAGATGVPLLLIDLAIIVLAARTFGALARRIGQPVVVGEIVAGILLGPTVLGRLFPGLPARLFPPDVPLRQIAELGLVFFMFLVGLELDPKFIKQEGRRAFTISLGGLVTPFVLGALIAVPLFALNAGGAFLPDVTARPTPLAFSLFMGAAMCITAFPVLARILVERGLYRAPLGTSALCAAAVDDAIAWILLAAVVGLTRTGSMAQAGSAFLLSAVYAAFMLTAGRWALRAIAARHEKTGRLTVDQVAAVVIGLLASAWVTEWIGIHSIFGAFVFGTIMPRGSKMTHELTDRIEDFTVVVLLPVFFTVAGLRTNLFAIDSLELVLWLVAIVAAAIFGKLAGCGIAARLNGYSNRDAFVLGTLMNTRGLTELVILNVGLTLGVLSDRTFAMMVVMALVTTFMAAPIINRIMPRRQMVRLLSGGDPTPAAARVLVALGNPVNAVALADAGVRLTGAARPAELLLTRLIPTARAPEFRTGLSDEESRVDVALADAGQLAARASASGVAARPVSFLSDNIGEDLANVAASQQCDAILLGWHRASMDREMLRGLVQRVFAASPCDVMVFVDRQGDGIARPDGPVLFLARPGDADGAAREIADRLAASLRTSVRRIEAPVVAEPSLPVEGFVRRLSTAITGRSSVRLSAPSSDRLTAGAVALDVAPETAAAFAGIVAESERAAAIVVAAGDSLVDRDDFEHPAGPISALAACPVLVVRPCAERRVASPAPSAAPSRSTIPRGTATH